MKKELTQAAFARQRGLSAPRINQLVKSGVITLTTGGKIDTETADRQIADFVDSRKDPGPKGTDASGDDSLVSWRRKELQVKVALKNLDYDEQKSRLVDAEELKVEFARLFTDIKTTLRAIPSKAAGELVHMARNAKTDREGMAAVSTLLLKEIDAALTELSRWQPKSNKKGGDKGKKTGAYKRR